jgi:hypothetical protein
LSLVFVLAFLSPISIVKAETEDWVTIIRGLRVHLTNAKKKEGQYLMLLALSQEEETTANGICQQKTDDLKAQKTLRKKVSIEVGEGGSIAGTTTGLGFEGSGDVFEEAFARLSLEEVKAREVCAEKKSAREKMYEVHQEAVTLVTNVETALRESIALMSQETKDEQKILNESQRGGQKKTTEEEKKVSRKINTEAIKATVKKIDENIKAAGQPPAPK